MSAKLTHIDDQNQPTMVDVGDKAVTAREAVARSEMLLPPEVVAAIEGDDIVSAKGPVFQTAIIAGTQAVKRTSDLIPFCHPLPVDGCKIRIRAEEGGRLVMQKSATQGRDGARPWPVRSWFRWGSCWSHCPPRRRQTRPTCWSGSKVTGMCS